MKAHLLIFILIAFVLRFWLSFLPGLAIDMNVWQAWAHRLTEFGLSRFYSPVVWTNYTPGYLYWLWFLGKINAPLALFKLIAIFADIAGGWLVFKLVSNKSKKIAFLLAISYWFNPAIIFNSSIWGQIDSLLALVLLLSLKALIDNRVFSSGFWLGLAVLIKPQAAFVIPVFLAKKAKISLLIGGIIALFLAWPFFPGNPLFGLPRLILNMNNDYPYTTLSAFNFWRIWGNWQSDVIVIFGLSKQAWGWLLFLFWEAIIIYPLLRNPKKTLIWLVAGLSLTNFYLFFTRIHERYLLPALIFLLIGGGLSRRHGKLIILSYWLLSLIHTVNLYLVYCLYQVSPICAHFSVNNLAIIILCLVSVGLFLALIVKNINPE